MTCQASITLYRSAIRSSRDDATHKSGCVSCQQPTVADPIASATEAEVKMEPAHANHPTQKEANPEYLCGARTEAQKYCPPALGSAEASSDKLIPTHVEISAIIMIP